MKWVRINCTSWLKKNLTVLFFFAIVIILLAHYIFPLTPLSILKSIFILLNTQLWINMAGNGNLSIWVLFALAFSLFSILSLPCTRTLSRLHIKWHTTVKSKQTCNLRRKKPRLVKANQKPFFTPKDPHEWRCVYYG